MTVRRLRMSHYVLRLCLQVMNFIVKLQEAVALQLHIATETYSSVHFL